MIRRRPHAITAIIDQAEYIGQDSLSAAERFLDATEATLRELEAIPCLVPWQALVSEDPRLADLRIRRVVGFRNHLIFYRPIDGGIEVVHLLHAARDIDHVLEDELGPGEDDRGSV
jgi:toxin ParE1/3/4